MPRLLTVFSALILLSQIRAENWPEFRGPTGQGHYEKSLPTEWSKTKNVVWKTAVFV
jgi:outer membrane protein assembly factor BamB